MMKSFFKKLAFVMALAMVVSMVAPAGSAFAAETGVSLQGTKTIVETYELEKAGATVDFSFQGAPKDWKTTFAWTSSNEAVATVNKAGIVTAVAAGTATITITAGADASYVETVKVTVKEEVKAEAFEIAQITANTVTLTFDKAPAEVDLAAGLTFNMVIAGVEITLPVNTVKVKDNVATVTVFTNFADGEEYSFTYDKNTVSFVASAGEIDHVGFTYYTGEDPTKNVGVAYVSTEEEDFYTTFVPKLYDVNNVDITSLYDLDDLEITYDLVNESDVIDIDNDVITFEGVAAAAVQMTVAWEDDDAEVHEKYFTGVVVAEKVPDIKLDFVNAGFIKVGSFTAGAQEAFTTKPWSPFWNGTISLSSSYKLNPTDTATYQFAALFNDNRGNAVVSGNTEYNYGSFSFASSNDDVLDISEDGELSFYEAGSATILVYFTAADDESETPVFIGAKKLTVKDAKYPASYKVLNTSITTASDVVQENQNDVTFKLQVYDQYNSAIRLADDSIINVEAVNEDNTVEPTGISWNNNDKLYEIYFDADDFDIEDKNYKTFKYNVSIEKVEDVSDKIKTGTTKISLKISKTVKAANELGVFLGRGGFTGTAADDFTYNFGGGYPIDLYVDHTTNYQLTDKDDETKLGWANGIKYYDGSLSLAEIPASMFEEIGKDVTTGDIGKVYYRVSAPAKAITRNEDGTLASTIRWTYSVVDGGFVLQWNGETPNAEYWNPSDEFDGYAETGTYSITVYTAKKNGGKLYNKGSYTFNVSNSQPDVTFGGFNPEYTNVTDESIADVESTLEEIVQTHFVFYFDGNKLDSEEAWTRCGYKIDWANSDYSVIAGEKLRVKKLAIVVPLDNGEGNYEYTSYVNVNKNIYNEED